MGAFFILFLVTVVSADIELTRQVSGFKGIEVAGPFLVDVDVTGSEGVRIVAAIDDTNVTDALLTVVEGNSLKIKFAWPYDVDVGNFAGLIHIYVTAKSVSSFVLSGSGAITVNTPLNNPAVSAVCSGSGNMSMEVKTQDMNVVLSGSGFINVRGTTRSMNVVVSGSGKVLTDQLAAGQASIAIYGSGDVTVNAGELLSVVQMGSGTVKYLGNPHLNAMRMGAGSVVRMELDSSS